MTPRLAIAILRRAGFPALAAAGIAWWAVHLDSVTRAERQQLEERYRVERVADRKEWLEALRQVAAACARSNPAPARYRDD